MCTVQPSGCCCAWKCIHGSVFVAVARGCRSGLCSQRTPFFPGALPLETCNMSQAGAVLFHPDLVSSCLTVSADRRTVTKTSGDQRWDMAVCPIGLGTSSAATDSAAPAAPAVPAPASSGYGGLKPRLGRSGSGRGEER